MFLFVMFLELAFGNRTMDTISMKILLSWIVVFSMSCTQSKSDGSDQRRVPAVPTIENPSSELPKPQNKEDAGLPLSAASIAFEKIKGDYFGEFVAVKFTKKQLPTMKNKIKISLKKLNSTMGILSGSSIVGGEKRDFSGSFVFANGTFKSTLKESGDSKYDGVFNVKIKTGELVGSWIANDEKLAVSERSFKLEKKTFKYDPKAKVTFRHDWRDAETKLVFHKWKEAGAFQQANQDHQLGTDFKRRRDDFWTHYDKHSGTHWLSPDSSLFSAYLSKNLNASTQKLSHEDVENMIKEDLAFTENSIYARHGYAFKDRMYRYYFERKVDWYLPVSTDVSNDLSEIEKSNIKLLKRYHKNATTYSKTFSRGG